MGRLVYVVPPGLEDVIARLVCPSPLPAGWSFASSQVDRHEIKALYRNPSERMVASLTLVHPSLAAPNVRRTERFALLLQTTRVAPSAGVLLDGLTANVRAHEAGFRWEEYEVVPQRLPPPGRPMDPLAGDGVTGARDPHATRSGWQPEDPVAEREIDEHLELVPWIDLQLEVDHQAMLAEAQALKDRFIVYRSDPSYDVKGWKGLAVWALDGDPEKAAMPEGAAANTDQRYAMTPIAKLCPRTMGFLSQVLDFEHSRAVAFLMLEPHSRIMPHCDDTQHEVMRSVNVALNMPDGCEFVIDTLPGGKPTPFTRTIPFRPGLAMMVNVAREHHLENRSDTPRIHIVARAPLKMPAAKLVELARAQNGPPETVRRGLDERYRTLGLPVEPPADATRYVRKPKLPFGPPREAR
jgi:hypothetical protein